MTIKILLVDDNPTFLAAVWQFIDMLPDVEVVGQAHDGREALAQAERLHPDLVLLDIAMPHVNGLEVARAMQAWPRPPRIVFLSMHDNVAYRDVARDLGAAGFVAKADFVDGLLPIIERMVADETASYDMLFHEKTP